MKGDGMSWMSRRLACCGRKPLIAAPSNCLLLGVLLLRFSKTDL